MGRQHNFHSRGCPCSECDSHGCPCSECELDRFETKLKALETTKPGGPTPFGYQEVDIPLEFEWWKEPSPIITTDNTDPIKMNPTAKIEHTANVSSELIEDLLEGIQKLKWEVVELRRELADDRRSRAEAANPEGFGQSFEETIGDGHEGETEG